MAQSSLTGAPQRLMTGVRKSDSYEQALAVNDDGELITGSPQLAVETRLARFDAVGDMPTNITNSSQVAGDIWTNTTFTSTARRIQAIWHQGPGSYEATAGAGPVAMGARLCINADDASDAATRLTYTDATGNTTTTSGKVDTFLVTTGNPLDITISAAITRIDAIGIPTGSNPTTNVPSFLELRILG